MKGQHHVFYKEQADELNDITVLYILGNGDEAYPDFIENPVYMVSECMQKVLDMYEDDLVFKKVALFNKEAQTQANYYQLLTDHIEGLSDRTGFYPDGTEKQIILDRQKVKEHSVFQLKGCRGNYLIVTLDIVESLLRRHVQGISFEEIEVI